MTGSVNTSILQTAQEKNFENSSPHVLKKEIDKTAAIR